MKLFSHYRGLRKEIYVLLFGRIMTNLGSMIWPLFTLILKDKMGFDATKIAIYMGILTVVCIPVTLLGGKITDKFNKKKIIVFCDFVSVSIYLICSIFEISFFTVIMFAVASLFQQIEWPAYDALTSDLSTTKDRERAFSLLYLGANIGLILAPTLGGLLFKEHLNLAFLINALAILSSTLLIIFKIKNLEKEVDEEHDSVYEKDLGANSSALKYLFSHRVIIIYILSCAAYGLVYSMYNYLMPIELSNIYGDNGAAIFGTYSSVNCITVVALTSIITKLFSKVRDATKMWIGQVLIIGGLLIFAIFTKYIVIGYIAMVIFTTGEIFDAISSSPFVSRRIPSSHRGRIMSISMVVSSLLSASGEIITGKVYDTFGPKESWYFVFIVGIISIFLITIMGALDKKDFKLLYDDNDNLIDNK